MSRLTGKTPKQTSRRTSPIRSSKDFGQLGRHDQKALIVEILEIPFVRWTALIAGTLALGLIGVLITLPFLPEGTRSSGEWTASSSTPVATTTPSVASYSVVEHDSNQNHWQSFRVRLSQRVSENELRRIAFDIESGHAGNHDRTAIFFYLPDTPIDDIAWATAHFEPDLKIRLLGATENEVASAQVLTRPAGGEVVGSWIIDQFGGSYRTWIIRQNGRVFMENRDTSGDGAIREPLIERRIPNGLRFDVPGSPAGDHWLVRPDGVLECRDNSGLIFTARQAGN